MKKAIYNGVELPVDGKTREQVKQAMAAFYPELANAEIFETAAGNYEFRVSGGTKGSK